MKFPTSLNIFDINANFIQQPTLPVENEHVK